MSITRRSGPRGTVYWIDFFWQGKRVWERSGADKRAADRLLATRRREVKEGTYLPEGERRATTFGQWLAEWIDKRSTRNSDSETAAVRRYVCPMVWLMAKPLADGLDADAALRMWTELRASVSETTGKTIGRKTAANIYASVRTAITAAKLKKLVHAETFILPKGTIKRRLGAAEREPYTIAEVRTLVTDARLSLSQRVWNALAFFTGMREGEIAGRTWRDWDPSPKPYTALRVGTQYDGRLLKTETEAGEHTRLVPVHPALAAILRAWWSEGFELVHLRKPTLDDPIVPAIGGGHHTRSSAYKLWVRSCAKVGVRNRSLHATRHTFVTLCLRGGALKEHVERCTHNAVGDIVDRYNHLNWSPLCRAVAAFGCDAHVDNFSELTVFTVEAPGIEPGSEDVLLPLLRV